MTANLTIYYNTRRPVCDAGINWQRNKLLALVRAGTVESTDINEQPEALAQLALRLTTSYAASMQPMRPAG